MAKSFRPGFYVEKKWISFPTYAELKRKLLPFILNSPDKEVVVYRHRRGEWGEWFEYWSINHEGKPVITKKGWM